MAEYLVTWEVELDASSPEAAAKLARQYQLDEASAATVFYVYDKDGVRHDIDLTPEWSA